MKKNVQNNMEKLKKLSISERHNPHKNIIMMWLSVFLLLNSINFTLCNSVKEKMNEKKLSSIMTTAENTTSLNSTISSDTLIAKFANESLLKACELYDEPTSMVWTTFLEDYVLSQSPIMRASKDLHYVSEATASGSILPFQMMINPGMGPNPSNPQPPMNYHSSVYKRPNIFINKRIGEVSAELEPHKRPPQQVAKPQLRPLTGQMTQPQPGFLQQLFGLGGSESSIITPTSSIAESSAPATISQHVRPLQLHQHLPLQQQQQVSPSSPQIHRAVSENELYLLGAIEKLVYRVDYLESRVRRIEQLTYYLMGGNKLQEQVREACPANFTRISDNCYYINSYQAVNWKTANSACKSLNSHLAEFERTSENEEIIAFLLNQPSHRGRDYWLGGLNPGLLWIWSNSAKPVNPNMNLTSIAMSHKQPDAINEPESNTIDVDEKEDKNKREMTDILNNTVDIEGQGRCLKLSYNSAKHSYNYYGQECNTRHHYICEHKDKTLDNKIKKIARELKLFN